MITNDNDICSDLLYNLGDALLVWATDTKLDRNVVMKVIASPSGRMPGVQCTLDAKELDDFVAYLRV